MHSPECRRYLMSHTNPPSTKASLTFLNKDVRLSRVLWHQMWGSPSDLRRESPFVAELEVVSFALMVLLT